MPRALQIGVVLRHVAQRFVGGPERAIERCYRGGHTGPVQPSPHLSCGLEHPGEDRVPEACGDRGSSRGRLP